jgi:hypothetical protein
MAAQRIQDCAAGWQEGLNPPAIIPHRIRHAGLIVMAKNFTAVVAKFETWQSEF